MEYLLTEKASWGIAPYPFLSFITAGGGTAILWDLTMPIEFDQVQDWIRSNRYVRELSCEERARYAIEPLCEE